MTHLCTAMHTLSTSAAKCGQFYSTLQISHRILISTSLFHYPLISDKYSRVFVELYCPLAWVNHLLNIYLSHLDLSSCRCYTLLASFEVPTSLFECLSLSYHALLSLGHSLIDLTLLLALKRSRNAYLSLK